MLIDRALHALICFGTGALNSLLRRSSQHLPESASGEPGQLVPPARTGTDEITAEGLPEDEPKTVIFGLDGQTYEINLDDEHASKLRSVLQRYIDAGRRIGPQATAPVTAGSARPRPSPSTRQRHDTAAIRAWARAHGHQVSDRGRIPAAVLKAYEADHRGSRRTG